MQKVITDASQLLESLSRGVSDDFARELIEFNAKVGEEDDDLTNSVQRALIGGQPDTGKFLSSSEHLIIQFQKLVVKLLGDA